MNYIYPAVFYPEENNTYSVIFPDLNDLATQGNTLEEAFKMAQDVVSLYIFTAIRDGEKLPTPSDLKDITKDTKDCFINLILIDLNEYAKKYNDKSIKKTLSIPSWLNTICEKYNINFSKVLQEALIEKIQKIN